MNIRVPWKTFHSFQFKLRFKGEKKDEEIHLRAK